MNEPMLTLVENAIAASFGPSAEAIPAPEFNALVSLAARAAIAALRTPTPEMVLAVPNDRNLPIYPEDIWQAMIDAALQEG